MPQDVLQVNSDLAKLGQVQEWFEQFYQQHVLPLGWPENQFYRLNLAVAEGFTNAVRHAHRDLPSETMVKLGLALKEDRRLEIRIWDYGAPFNPDVLEEPEPGTLKQHWGWFLLRRVADEVAYQRCPDDRNCLVIVKHDCTSDA